MPLFIIIFGRVPYERITRQEFEIQKRNQHNDLWCLRCVKEDIKKTLLLLEEGLSARKTVPVIGRETCLEYPECFIPRTLISLLIFSQTHKFHSVQKVSAAMARRQDQSANFGLD